MTDSGRCPHRQAARPGRTDARSRYPWRRGAGPLALLLASLLVVPGFAGGAEGAPAAGAPDGPPLAQPPRWTGPFLERIAQLDQRMPGRLGVYVKDLESGLVASYRGDERWYLASMVKVPVAIAVLRRVEAGTLALDTRVRLLASDYVDGAGPTNRHPPGTSLEVRYLLEQMLVHSDNTASDLLIRLVGIEAVNQVTHALVPEGFGPITSLADVRRQVYGQVHPGAGRLSGQDFLALRRQPDDTARVALLARLLAVPPRALAPISLAEAYERYYAMSLNSGRLSAYAELLGALQEGRALSPEATDYLLGVMRRAQTGAARIRAGLPATAGFAHKTGTQRARICDAGIVEPQAAARGARPGVVVVACVRDAPTLAAAERALRGTGETLVGVGLVAR